VTLRDLYLRLARRALFDGRPRDALTWAIMGWRAGAAEVPHPMPRQTTWPDDEVQA